MEQYRDQRIAALKDRIFLLQIEERRYCAILTSPRRNEELTVQAKKNLKAARDLLGNLTAELASLLNDDLPSG